MKLSLSASHELPVATLLSRIGLRVQHFDTTYPSLKISERYRWSDERRAVAEYRGGSASVTLSETSVQIELELPFFARVYRSRIETFVRTELNAVTQP